MKQLKGRVAVVTGAGSGIGRGVAQELAAEGCKLALVDINAETLEETAEMLKSAAPALSTHVVDVSDREAMLTLPEAVIAEHGEVHVVVNNAGVAVFGTFDEMSWEHIEKVINVNLWGVLHGSKAFLPYLAMVDEAWIINISSVFGLAAIPTQSIYCATKFAVRGFTETLDEELRGTHIGVSVVHPGAIDTAIVHSPSYDQGASENSKKHFARHGMDPRKAGRVIVDGMKAGKLRIMVGKEAPLIDLVKRIAPVAGNRFLVNQTVKTMGLQELRDRKLAKFLADAETRRAEQETGDS